MTIAVRATVKIEFLYIERSGSSARVARALIVNIYVYASVFSACVRACTDVVRDFTHAITRARVACFVWVRVCVLSYSPAQTRVRM